MTITPQELPPLVRCSRCGKLIQEAAPTRMRVVCVECTGIDFEALEEVRE